MNFIFIRKDTNGEETIKDLVFENTIKVKIIGLVKNHPLVLNKNILIVITYDLTNKITNQEIWGSHLQDIDLKQLLAPILK